MNDHPDLGTPAGTPAATPGSVAPASFEESLYSLRAARLRPEMVLDEVPAPTRLASFAAALTGEVTTDPAGRDPEAILAHGRFVVLHEPDGQPAWDGTTRVVVMARAALDAEMGDDPLLGEVGWAWLVDALTERGAGLRKLSGTVTRVMSETFGGLTLAGSDVEIEVRASWTPVSNELTPHLEAWADLCCAAGGLEPLPPGVEPLSLRRRASGGRR